ncbi:MAG: aspartate aminotransferase family protein [Clostridiales bacterium]|jgi:predicted acetylornithine/succinylornithine family transaminase|nr:aspartate aminotransferase family protein [Clostridiales bacterium]
MGIQEEYAAAGMETIMNTYSRFPIVLEKGSGCYVFDAAGKKYLDFVAGIAVNVLGHGHEKLTRAVAEQAGNLIHVSNLYWNKPQIELARKLIRHTCFDKVFFGNSGAEAIEGSLKLARKYADNQQTGRTEIVAMKNSFHGRTFAALTVTGQEKYQKGFQPLLPGVRHAAFNDFAALEAVVNEKTCAVLIEPIQGEGGIRPADPDYLRKVRALCDEKAIALIFDEIQCGVGRTGMFFAFEHFEVTPDVAVLAKGMAGGVPIGVILARRPYADAFAPGEHASTFGGNPLATAVANAVADELWENGLLAHARDMGLYLWEKLNALQRRFPETIKEIRGMGLMLGMELNAPAAPLTQACLQRGLLLVNAGANVIRFVPPLIVSRQEIDEAIEILADALTAPV